MVAIYSVRLPHSGTTGPRPHVPLLHNRVLPRVHCNVRHHVIPITNHSAHARQARYIYYLCCIKCCRTNETKGETACGAVHRSVGTARGTVTGEDFVCLIRNTTRYECLHALIFIVNALYCHFKKLEIKFQEI